MARLIDKSFTVSAELGFCDGHFPGHPIVPGAVQLLWLVALAQEHGLTEGVYSVSNMKLLKELPPGKTVRLELAEIEAKWRGRVLDADGDVISQCKLTFSKEERSEA